VGWWISLALARAHEARGIAVERRWEALLRPGWAATGDLCRRWLPSVAGLRSPAPWRRAFREKP